MPVYPAECMTRDDDGTSLSVQSDSDLISRLNELGVGANEAAIYVALVESGPMSVLGLSRDLDLPRTNIYRAVENLRELGLAGPGDGAPGSKVSAAPPECLERLVMRHQQRVERQKELLPSILGELTNLSGKGPLGSRITYYEGMEGLRQVTVNSLDARNGLCIYELETMTAFAGEDFSEWARREIVRRQIFHRQLTNLERIAGFSDVEGLADIWEVRHVPPTELNIEFEILIYNDIFALYTYRDDEIFCAEIRSAALNSMQRALFDLVWKRARKMYPDGPRLARSTKPTARPTRRL